MNKKKPSTKTIRFTGPFIDLPDLLDKTSKQTGESVNLIIMKCLRSKYQDKKN